MWPYSLSDLTALTFLRPGYDQEASGKRGWGAMRLRLHGGDLASGLLMRLSKYVGMLFGHTQGGWSEHAATRAAGSPAGPYVKSIA
jgi:hypothetical protein